MDLFDHRYEFVLVIDELICAFRSVEPENMHIRRYQIGIQRHQTSGYKAVEVVVSALAVTAGVLICVLNDLDLFVKRPVAGFRYLVQILDVLVFKEILVVDYDVHHADHRYRIGSETGILPAVQIHDVVVSADPVRLREIKIRYSRKIGKMSLRYGVDLSVARSGHYIV